MVEVDFLYDVESKVAQQLHSQRVGYLLGAGSSYLNGDGYPLAFELWELIKDRILDSEKRRHIQEKIDCGAHGVEQALDLLDDGGALDTPYRHLVIDAIAELFLEREPDLELHSEFVKRLALRADPQVQVFSLNYDPLLERAAEKARVRLADGFVGIENAFFDPAVFAERIGRIRGTHRGRQFEETVKPIRLFKLHGSLGWYESNTGGVRRCLFRSNIPPGTKRLMVPPQRRKAADTMLPPYSALWSTFRGCLCHNENPLNRLASFGYGFADEHVNAVVDAAMARPHFTLLVFSRSLSDPVWSRWSQKQNAIVVTKARCSLNGRQGPGHPDLWSFERVGREV